jgi:hypothetical protein
MPAVLYILNIKRHTSVRKQSGNNTFSDLAYISTLISKMAIEFQKLNEQCFN